MLWDLFLSENLLIKLINFLMADLYHEKYFFDSDFCITLISFYFFDNISPNASEKMRSMKKMYHIYDYLI